MNNERIGSKFIEVVISSSREYENFVNHNFINAAPIYSKDRMPNIPLEKRKNTLLMTGLPFDITVEELIGFFKNSSIIKDEIHMINNHNNKFSGNALIVFEDEMEA
jgi:RNA recognition motif-containing protein